MKSTTKAKPQSEQLAEKGVITLREIVRQALANSSDVLLGKITHQRAAQSASNLRVALQGISNAHNMGDDITPFLEPKKTA